MNRVGMTRVVLAIACVAAPLPSLAQSYPTKPVFIVVPFAAGGGLDIFFRAAGQRLSDELGQPVQVENRAGANGIIGAEYVSRSAPDGYTLLAASDSAVINSTLYKKLPYDLLKDLAPVSTLVTSAGNVLVVHPSVPFRSVKEMIELAREKPGQLSYASFGIGSTYHLGMEMLQAAASIRLNHIPYKGTAPAIADVAAGRVEMMFSSINSALPYTKSAKLKMLAVGTSRRLQLFPDVPTIAESGVPGFDIPPAWYGLLARAGTPKPIVDRLNDDARKAISQPAFRTKFLDPQGLEPLFMTPDQFGALLSGQLARWTKVVRDANVSLD